MPNINELVIVFTHFAGELVPALPVLTITQPEQLSLKETISKPFYTS